MNEYDNFYAKIPSWLRWPLVPITAILTVIFVYFFASILVKILVFIFGDKNLSENFYKYLIIPAFSAYCSIVVATLVAPYYKKLVAILIASLFIFTAGVITFFAIFYNEWRSLIVVASLTFGCGAAALQLYPDTVIETR